MLITTRDDRVASILAKAAKPIVLQPMSKEESKSLFLSKFQIQASNFDATKVYHLIDELDHLPLAVNQAAILRPDQATKASRSRARIPTYDAGSPKLTKIFAKDARGNDFPHCIAVI